jgi:ferritin
MDAKVYELLNLYIDFANYYEEEGLSGFANWYMIQAQEERDHALKFRDYLHENGQKVVFEAIEKPGKVFTNHIQPLEAGLEHEKYVTSLINDIYSAAVDAKDYRTMKFLDWFISEQGEEEDNAETMLTRMKLFGNDAKTLYDLDQEYAARVYTAPAE